MIPLFNLDKIELFNWKGFKLPKVFRRKLGKNKSWGFYHSDNTIEVDSSLKGKKELEIYLHEVSHGIFPEFSEEKIIQVSRIYTDFLWNHHYRKVDNDD